MSKRSLPEQRGKGGQQRRAHDTERHETSLVPPTPPAPREERAVPAAGRAAPQAPAVGQRAQSQAGGAVPWDAGPRQRDSSRRQEAGPSHERSRSRSRGRDRHRDRSRERERSRSRSRDKARARSPDRKHVRDNEHYKEAPDGCCVEPAEVLRECGNLRTELSHLKLALVTPVPPEDVSKYRLLPVTHDKAAAVQRFNALPESRQWELMEAAEAPRGQGRASKDREDAEAARAELLVVTQQLREANAELQKREEKQRGAEAAMARLQALRHEVEQAQKTAREMTEQAVTMLAQAIETAGKAPPTACASGQAPASAGGGRQKGR